MDWLTLNEYSKRYQISLAALENKIRLGQIEYIFTGGAYRVKDKPLFEISPFASSKPEEGEDHLRDRVKQLKKLLIKKDQELKTLKASYEDAVHLIQWLEKDNQEMKRLFLDVRRLEQWLNEPSKPQKDY